MRQLKKIRKKDNAHKSLHDVDAADDDEDDTFGHFEKKFAALKHIFLP